jgi:hypothetical protein
MLPVPRRGCGTRHMYQSAMGPAFDRLHPALQRFHALAGRWTLQGQVRIEPPQRRLGRLLARMTGTPRTAREGPIEFQLEAAPHRERWLRRFPGFHMASALSLHGGEIVERLGPATLHFTLGEQSGALVMELQRMQFAGIPCPRWLMPRIHAVERGEGDRLHFDVRADVPGCGRVVRYHGQLLVPQHDREAR